MRCVPSSPWAVETRHSWGQLEMGVSHYLLMQRLSVHLPAALTNGEACPPSPPDSGCVEVTNIRATSATSMPPQPLSTGAHALAMQVIMAHGDVVPAPGGKAAFQQGSAAFFAEVANRRRQRQDGGGAWPSQATLLAAAGLAGAAGVAVAYVWQRRSR